MQSKIKITILKWKHTTNVQTTPVPYYGYIWLLELKHPHREGILSNTWGRDWQLYASSPGNLHQYSLRSYKKL